MLLVGMSTKRKRHIIGCMTGTSLDGLDVVLAEVVGGGRQITAKYIGMASRHLSELGDELSYFACGNPAEPIRYLRAARLLGNLHADVIGDLLKQHNDVTIDFVVAHGQTICHAPHEHLSWQLFDPWPIIRRLNVPVLHDLRQADLVAGGQGAPITPRSTSTLPMRSIMLPRSSMQSPVMTMRSKPRWKDTRTTRMGRKSTFRTSLFHTWATGSRRLPII